MSQSDEKRRDRKDEVIRGNSMRQDQMHGTSEERKTPQSNHKSDEESKREEDKTESKAVQDVPKKTVSRNARKVPKEKNWRLYSRNLDFWDNLDSIK